MTAKEKKRFKDMAAKDKVRYSREIKSSVPAPADGRRKRKNRKDPNAPKRPLSAFFAFCSLERRRVRAAHPEWRLGRVAKELGRLWKTCPNKKWFENTAAKDQRRYEAEMAAYQAGTFNGAKRARAAGHVEDEETDDEDDTDDYDEEEEEDDGYDHTGDQEADE